jgi:hypothetical protein
MCRGIHRIAFGIAVVIAALFGSISRAEDVDHYAAVAYSNKTGAYWIAFGAPTKVKAEADVKKRFKDGDEPTIVSVKNCYISLAMSADGKTFGVGDADSKLEAGRRAIADCKKHSKQKCAVVVTLHAAQGVDGDSYASIAYSTSTGKYGVSVAKASKSEAEQEAIEKCGVPDAKVVASAKNMSCALALGKDKSVYGVGIAKDEKEAKKIALAECEKKTTDCRVVLCLEGKQ